MGSRTSPQAKTAGLEGRAVDYFTYAFFAAIPFLQGTVLGHVYLPEIPLAVLAVLVLLGHQGRSTDGVRLLDVAVLAYAGFSLISVILGSDSLYESARYYRGNVLAPVIGYAVLSRAALRAETLRNAFLWMMPGLLVAAVLFVRYYLAHHQRPVGIEGIVTSSITISLLFCIGATAALYFFRDIKGKARAGALLAAGTAFSIGLIFSGGRMSLASLVTLGLLAPLVAHSRRLWRFQSFGILALLAVLLAAVVVGPSGHRTIQPAADRVARNTVERLYDVDMYMNDAFVRLRFWHRIATEALKSPLLGSGADRYSIGNSAGTGFRLGSAHNALVSALIVLGVPGVLFLAAFVYGANDCLAAVVRQRGTLLRLGMTLWVAATSIVLTSLTNDLTGGRAFLWFSIMGVCRRFSSLCAEESADAERAVSPQRGGRQRALHTARSPGSIGLAKSGGQGGSRETNLWRHKHGT